tara:strand:- start:411 stop:1301 length:891 start_codon:yes stop_codon:yes gene_type:complete
MSFNLDDVNIGGQLKIGTGIVPAIKEGDERINGSMYAEGPVVLGGESEFSDNKATLMVGRTRNNDKDCEPADRSLWVNGNMFLNGDDGTPYALNQVGNTLINGNSQTPNALKISGGSSVDTLFVDGDVFVTGSVDCLSKGRLEARHAVADSKPKAFDIPHPSREKHRLRYACIEGPEVGVYVRGRVKNEKVIVLPKYWKNLVHEESITVQLQPIGAHQDIIIKRWDDEKIYLQARGGMPINCFYHVYAERKDVNPLIVEYEGNECFDYPDPNYKPGVENPDYKDPQFAGPPNTITK